MLAKFRILLCLVLLLPLHLFAQSQQQVVVREYREKSQKTPLKGVSLSVQNAGSVLSDAQGSMTLQFRTLKAGDQVQVRRVDMDGYEIFNRDAVDQWTISPQQAFNLVLCRSDLFKQMRDQYMRVSSASYERQYKQDQARLAALRKENKLQEEAYQQQLTELENNYYEQLENLENYVDKFARIDLSELSAQEQHLIELVQEGRVEEAIDLYESADYLSQYTTQVNELKEIDCAQAMLAQVEAEKLTARDKIQAAINRQVQTYQLAGGRENFNKIAALLKGVADADTTNLDALWAYGDHCLHQNKFDECEKYTNLYLRQCVDNKKAQVLACLNLGRMYGSKYVFDLAEKYFLESVRLAKEYYEENPNGLILFVDARCALHTLYIYIGQPEKLLSFTESLKNDLEKMNEEYQDVWLEKLSTFYAEQGFMYHYNNNNDLAESLFIKSYNLAQLNVDKSDASPKSIENKMNSILMLNLFYYNTEQWVKMETYMLEEKKYREESYQKNPDIEIRYLLGVYNNLSELYYHLNNSEQSHLYLDKALFLLPDYLELYDEVTVSYDEMNLYDVASQLYYKEGNRDLARQYATRCLDAYDKVPDELKGELEDLFRRNQEYLK